MLIVTGIVKFRIPLISFGTYTKNVWDKILKLLKLFLFNEGLITKIRKDKLTWK